MRVAIFFLLMAPALAWGVSCPTSVPTTYPAPSGNTPQSISSTACTGTNGFSTTGIKVISQVFYNTTATGCTPYAASGAMSFCDLMWIGPAEATSSNCSTLVYYHGGAWWFGSNGEGGNGDPFGTTTPLFAVQLVQSLVGTPNSIGGNYTCLGIVNYRLTTNAGGTSTNLAPTQWQDAKGSLWFVLDNPSIFPSDITHIGCFGDSAGGALAFFACNTPNNAYTVATGSPAVPSTWPITRTVLGWPGLMMTTPTGNSYFDGEYTNVSAQKAVLGWLWSAANVSTYGSITTYGVAPASYNPSQVPSVIRSQCAALGTYGCSPYDNIQSANVSWLNNIYIQVGSRGNTVGSVSAPGPDGLVCPFWNSSSGCVSTPGAATGGMELSVLNAFAAAGAPMPQFDEFYSYNGKYGALCYHECSMQFGLSDPALKQKIAYLLNSQQSTGSGGLGGSVGGS